MNCKLAGRKQLGVGFVTVSNTVLRGKGENIRQRTNGAGNALKYLGFPAPKALHLPPVAAHPFTGFLPLFKDSAAGTVQGPVASGLEWLAAGPAAFQLITSLTDGRAQLCIRRQDRLLKIPAEKGVRNALHTDASLAFIQGQAVAFIIVGAQAADQFPGVPELALRHAGLIHSRTPA